MEKKKNNNLISIIALLICVCALSVGFAAYAQTLKIENTTVEVKPSNSLDVHFPKTGTIVPQSNDGIATGDTINLNSGTVIANLKAYFQHPGQYITYTTKIINDSSYKAYLRSINFSLIEVQCSPFTDSTNPNPASNSTILLACPNMKMYVTIDGLVSNVNTNQSNLSNKYINSKSSVDVIIKLAYEGSNIPDGDFKVNFGDVSFNFSSENYLE